MDSVTRAPRFINFQHVVSEIIPPLVPTARFVVKRFPSVELTLRNGGSADRAISHVQFRIEADDSVEGMIGGLMFCDADRITEDATDRRFNVLPLRDRLPKCRVESFSFILNCERCLRN